MDAPLLIFSDLDGTLLDHQGYSYAGAEQALARLRRLHCPLILTSSKTCAEILGLQRRLGLHEPFIVENGGGIFLPPGHPLEGRAGFAPLGECQGIRFGTPYATLRAVFEGLRGAYGLRGFGDMTTAEIMERTGLPREEAVAAARRDFSEPFVFLGEPRPAELAAQVAAQGLTVTRGGRFFHLMSAGQDKGRAVVATTRLFQAGRGSEWVTVGLGDAENDFPMLAAVTLPVLLPRPDGGYADLDLPGLRKAAWPGSRGWGAAVMGILDEYTSLA